MHLQYLMFNIPEAERKRTRLAATAAGQASMTTRATGDATGSS